MLQIEPPPLHRRLCRVHVQRATLFRSIPPTALFVETVFAAKRFQTIRVCPTRVYSEDEEEYLRRGAPSAPRGHEDLVGGTRQQGLSLNIPDEQREDFCQTELLASAGGFFEEKNEFCPTLGEHFGRGQNVGPPGGEGGSSSRDGHGRPARPAKNLPHEFHFDEAFEAQYHREPLDVGFRLVIPTSAEGCKKCTTTSLDSSTDGETIGRTGWSGVFDFLPTIWKMFGFLGGLVSVLV